MSVFVDTNVLVYARDASEPVKQPLAAAWMEALWESKRGRLSSQVLQEYYATVTGKLSPGLDRGDARREVRALAAWKPVPVDVPVLEEAWSLQDRFNLSWWDALIVAAARGGGCSYLLTEDLQGGQSFGSLRVVDPFRTSPSELLV